MIAPIGVECTLKHLSFYWKSIILSYFERKIKSVMRNRSSPFKSRHFCFAPEPSTPNSLWSHFNTELSRCTQIERRDKYHSSNLPTWQEFSFSLSLSLCRNTSLVVNQAPCTLANHRLRSDKYSLILYGYQYFTPAVMTRDSCE